jgi:uncharacterized membrane protein YfcA
MMPPLAILLVAGLIFLLAGMVKGVIGLGLPTVAMGLLVLVTTPAEAAAVLIVPSLVTNVWQLATGPNVIGLARRLWSMMAGICIGAFVGAGLLARTDATLESGGLGAALVLYGALGLSGVCVSVPSRLEPWLSPLVGAATGVVTGATGVFVVPAVPGVVQIRVTPKTRNPFTIRALSISGVTWKWRFLNHAPSWIRSTA